jgi:hypothetical protein
MTVSRLLQEADSKEISSWIAFFSLENENSTTGDYVTDQAAIRDRLKATAGMLGTWTE